MRTPRITGLDTVHFDELVALLEDHIEWNAATGQPKALTVVQAVTATLLYYKNNLTQEVIAALMFVDQSTISRTIASMERLIAEVLTEYVPDLEETTRGTATVIDGSLTPCWSWRSHPELYSGKHHTTGHSHQFIVALDGRLAHLTDPLPGSFHDTHAARDSGVFDILDPANMFGDKGYLGTGVITPFRKPPGGQLLDWQRQFNTDVNTHRYVAERAIANFKVWRLFHTDYRRPLSTYQTAFTTVRALYFYSQS